MARIPVLPEAIPVGTLPALSRSSTYGLPRLQGGLYRQRLIGLRQRIRPRRTRSSGQDGDTRVPVLINCAAVKAVECPRLAERRSTVRPSRRHPLANTRLAFGRFPVQTPEVYAAMLGCAANRSCRRSTAQENHRAGDPGRLVGEGDNRNIAIARVPTALLPIGRAAWRAQRRGAAPRALRRSAVCAGICRRAC